MNDLEQLIADHESLSLTLYKCPAGKLTIGYGYNIEDRGITEELALQLLRSDILSTISELKTNFPWFSKIKGDKRRMAIIDMCYNLGLPRFKTFKNMIKALKNYNYISAACEASDSNWYNQVGRRGKTIVHMIRNNEVPT